MDKTDINNRNISRIKSTFREGMVDAIPVGLGYLAVSFSLGIAAGGAGFSIFQGFMMSLTSLSSSGEYAGIVLVREAAPLIMLCLMIFVANARYMLMSCAISQRFDPAMPFFHRLTIGFGLTDELFGLGIATPGYIHPGYMYGAFLTSIPGWCIGTCLGIYAGNVLPPIIAEAMNVAIFGMFLAIIIPPAKKDRVTLLFVILSFLCSFLFSVLPLVKTMESGTRTLILTIILSAAAAFFFPRKDENEGEESTANT